MVNGPGRGDRVGVRSSLKVIGFLRGSDVHHVVPGTPGPAPLAEWVSGAGRYAIFPTSM